MKEFEIRKDIPLPEIPLTLIQKMPLLTMAVGDSFFVSNDSAPLAKLRPSLAAFSKAYRSGRGTGPVEPGKENLGFLTREEKGGSRVWRYR